MKQKCPAELNSKVIRISLSTYLLLKELSLVAGVTMAEAVDQLLARQAEPKAKPIAEPVAIATKPAFRVTTPIALPVTAPVAYRSGPITAIATNGSKVAAFRIQSKGVRRYD